MDREWEAEAEEVVIREEEDQEQTPYGKGWVTHMQIETT